MKAIATHEKSLLRPVLKAAVIYDDFEFAARAAALLELAGMHADEALEWDVKPWRLDLLSQPALGEEAVAETAGADLIVFAAGKTHSPPDELMDWLEYWALRRQIQDAAVVLLFSDEPAVATPFGVRLKQFAKRHGLTFLNSAGMPGDGDSLQFIHRLHGQHRPVVPALESPADLPRPPQHWGINE